MMKVTVQSSSHSSGQKIDLTCPHCGVYGAFDPVGQDLVSGQFQLGHRICPGPKCRGHVFVVLLNGKIVRMHPGTKTVYDKSNIPSRIVSTFDEAIECHAIGCFTASAILVRKTLEVLCEEQAATGGNLKERIASLKQSIILPEALMQGLDEIRLLGNDAAHVNSELYAQIGKDEVDVAMEFTREILKALYQYQGLLDRINSLKKPAPPAPPAPPT